MGGGALFQKHGEECFAESLNSSMVLVDMPFVKPLGIGVVNSGSGREAASFDGIAGHRRNPLMLHYGQRHRAADRWWREQKNDRWRPS